VIEDRPRSAAGRGDALVLDAVRDRCVGVVTEARRWVAPVARDLSATSGLVICDALASGGRPIWSTLFDERQEEASKRMSFGKRLAEERRRLLRKQAEFADLVGTNVAKQSLYENDGASCAPIIWPGSLTPRSMSSTSSPAAATRANGLARGRATCSPTISPCRRKCSRRSKTSPARSATSSDCPPRHSRSSPARCRRSHRGCG
jgi:hypothetical protein